MGYRIDIYVSLVGNRKGKRLLGKSMLEIEVRSKWIFRKRNRFMDWIDTAQSRTWKEKLRIVIMNLTGCIRCGEFLD
jgi:hypothetical protein